MAIGYADAEVEKTPINLNVHSLWRRRTLYQLRLLKIRYPSELKSVSPSPATNIFQVYLVENQHMKLQNEVRCFGAQRRARYEKS
jgi:hypothetical protein